MKHDQLLRIVLCSSAAALFTGCSTPINTTPAITSSGTSTSGGGSGSTGTSSNLQSPTILVSEATAGDENILAFDGSGNGEMRPSWTLPGTHPHLDAAGNLYVIRCFFPRQSCTETSQRIEVYGPDLSVTTPLRSIPTGPGTKIPKLVDMAVSRTGEIFVADGNGVAVFDPTATGNVDPARYILWSASKGELHEWVNIAVDDADNLYVRNGTAIAVFGPKDTGAAKPTRIIGGPHTQMADQSTNYYDNTWSMTLDTQGNVYVLCSTVRQDGLNPLGVLVFGPGANGDATPVRYITTPGMSTGYYGDPTGVVVDQAGTLYVSASPPEDADAKLFIFPQGVSGSVTPSRVITTPNSFHTGEILWWYNGGGVALVP
jgi:hypothetical protein